MHQSEHIVCIIYLFQFFPCYFLFGCNRSVSVAALEYLIESMHDRFVVLAELAKLMATPQQNGAVDSSLL